MAPGVKKKRRPFLSFLRRSPNASSLSPNISPSVSPPSTPTNPSLPSLSPSHSSRTLNSQSGFQTSDLPDPSQSFVSYVNHGYYTHPSRQSPNLSYNFTSSSSNPTSSAVASPSSHSSRYPPSSPKLSVSSPRASDADALPRPLSSSHRLSLDSIHRLASPKLSLTPGRSPIAPVAARRRNSLGSGIGASVLASLVNSQAEKKAKERSSLSLMVSPPTSPKVISTPTVGASGATGVSVDTGAGTGGGGVVAGGAVAGSMRPPRPKPRSMSVEEKEAEKKREEDGVKDRGEGKDRARGVTLASSRVPDHVVSPSVSSTLSPRAAKAASSSLQSPKMANAHAELMEALRRRQKARADGGSFSDSDEDIGAEGERVRESARLEAEQQARAALEQVPQLPPAPKRRKRASAFMRYLKSKLLAEVHTAPDLKAARKLSQSHHTKGEVHHSHAPSEEEAKREEHGHPHHHHHHHHHLRHRGYDQLESPLEGAKLSRRVGLLNEAPAMSHTKSAPAPAPHIPKLQPFKGLIHGAQKSLSTAFASSVWDEDDEKAKDIGGSLVDRPKEREKKEERGKVEEQPSEFKGLVERMTGRKKQHGVSFAATVVEKEKGKKPAPRNLLMRSKRAMKLDTTLEEEEEEEDEDDRSDYAGSNPSSQPSSSRPSLSLPPSSPAPQSDEEPSDAPSTFSFFKSKKPSLSLALTSKETIEDEEATIDVFDGSSADASASKPRGLPSLALGGDGDDDDGGGHGFSGSDTYNFSSHETLNLGQFKINSQGLVSGPKSAPGSRQGSPKLSADDEGEEGGIVMLTDSSTDLHDLTHSYTPHHLSASSPDAVEVSLTKDDLVEIGICGKGQNGVVKKAIHLPTLTRVALKSHVIFDKGTRHQLRHELEAYVKLQSPYLVSFLGAYHDSGSIIMATEFMDQGSLQSFQKKKKEMLTERIVCDIAYKALMGLHFLHSSHQVHRDVKPDNFLVNSKGEVKVTLHHTLSPHLPLVFGGTPPSAPLSLTVFPLLLWGCFSVLLDRRFWADSRAE